jgi:HK97 family phage major capsid protein/HK97 family phage prohead protease
MPEKPKNPFTAEREAGHPVRFRRSMRIERVDDEKKTVDISFSSDVDLERWPGYFEKLSHDAGACDLTRLNADASCLWNHDWDVLLGVVDRAWVDGGKGYATVRFGSSEKAKEVWPDVRDKIIRNVSVGYEILAEELTRNDETGYHYTVTRWSPYEVSFVTVPADITVGAGRTLEAAGLTSQSRKNMPLETAPAAPAATAATATPPAAAAPAITDVRDKEALRDAKTILELGKLYDARDLAQDAVAAGQSVGEFKSALLERAKKAVAVRTEHPLGLSDKEIQEFSFARLVAASIPENLGGSRSHREAAGFEMEVVSAAAKEREKRTGKPPQGHFIPAEILSRGKVKLTEEQRQAYLAKRAAIGISVGDSNAVATTVPFLDVASFAELLRPEAILLNLCTVVSGLEGTFEIPKQVSGSTGGWVQEDQSVSGQDAIFLQLQATPHTAGAFIDITRRASLQSALPLESILRTGLAEGLGQTVDLAGYYGTGANGQPKGLTLTDGVKIVEFAGVEGTNGSDGVNPEWTELVNMETVIAEGNVKISPQSGAYLFAAAARGWLKTRQKVPGTPTGATIWEPGDTVNGYKTGVTNQIQVGHYFLGNWKELHVCFWSGLDMIVNPFRFAESGKVRISVLQDLDYLNRRPEAFTFGFHP